MNEKGNKYALAALKNRRGLIAGDIVRLERQLRHKRENLIHVDATIKILDPDVDTASIPNRRSSKRIRVFRSGELGRLILGALRAEDGQPISAQEIVSHILKERGYDEGARRDMSQRVRANLAYLQRRGIVEKIDEQRHARWKLKAT